MTPDVWLLLEIFIIYQALCLVFKTKTAWSIDYYKGQKDFLGKLACYHVLVWITLRMLE